MSHQGRITDWNDDRGFGFITPNGGGGRVFVHISAFGSRQRRPVGNEIVTYELVKDARKGNRAANVRYRETHPSSSHSNWNRFLRPVISVIVIAILAYGFIHNQGISLPGISSWTRSTESSLQEAYHRRQSDLQVQGEGVVTRILADDLDGSRHQRFILRLETGQTVLVAHNIDLAPRIGGLRTGDSVAFYGEYEWNPQGGVIHWTHRDPAGRHTAGWLKHDGELFQ
jgi:cold shock CspA family protein